MNITLIDREPTPVAYLRYTGPFGEPLAQFWRQTVYPWLAENALLHQPRYGISQDDPCITEPNLCRYDACVEIPSGFTSQENIPTTIIPGGRYAVLHFQGAAEEIGEAWNSLLRDWLPASGFRLDARLCFEYYPINASHNPQTGIFDCDICIPVVAL